MTCVIAETCIDMKNGVCTEVRPVDCVCEGGRIYCIQPGECVSCALHVSVRPVEAIRYEDDLPPRSTGFVAVNSEFFDDAVRGRGRFGGSSPEFRTGKDRPAVDLARVRVRNASSPEFRTDKDHPVVAAWESNGG